MSLVIYENGIVENYVPKKHTFTDDELLYIFKENDYIHSIRLLEIPNVWVIWGEDEKKNEDNIASVASNMLGEAVYTPIMVIHDSEIDPEWNLTDDVLYTSYQEFHEQIIMLVNDISKHIIEETKRMREIDGSNNANIYLTNEGISKDKRVIFGFDPTKQTTDFYKDTYFGPFANKVFNYLSKKKTLKDSGEYVGFSDNKIIIKLKKEHIKKFMDKLIMFFNKKEEYEKCKLLSDIITGTEETNSEKE